MYPSYVEYLLAVGHMIRYAATRLAFLLLAGKMRGLMHFHLLHCTPARYHLAALIFKAVVPDLLVRILPGTKIRGCARWKLRIGGITPSNLNGAACGRCFR